MHSLRQVPEEVPFAPSKRAGVVAATSKQATPQLEENAEAKSADAVAATLATPQLKNKVLIEGARSVKGHAATHPVVALVSTDSEPSTNVMFPSGASR